jgi:cytoskeletal protein CcmA (bactofilin family)
MSTIPNNNVRNVLNADVEIRGNLKFTGELNFSGKLDGEIESEGTQGALQLGDDAVVRGDINLNSVVLRGKINGNVWARERIEIKSKGELFGDIRASKLIIEEGATFVGRCDVNPNKPATSPALGTPGAAKISATVLPVKK